MKKATPKLIITFVCLLVLLVGYYAYLSNKDRVAKDEVKISAIQETLSRDLKNNYPATPKEVIKYYNEIMKCFYNEGASEEEIDDLGEKARELYDAELLEANELGTYTLALREDVQDFEDNSRRIATAVVASSTNVDYFEEDGFEFARIMCAYTIMEGETGKPTTLVYLLRKDENNRWKIYGWANAADLQLYQQEQQADDTE